MYLSGKLCVPTDLEKAVVMGHHIIQGHAGTIQLVRDLRLRYIFPAGTNLTDIVRRLRQACVTCQVSEPPNWQISGKIGMTPVPERVLWSVCLDIFSFPLVEWQGQEFDSLVL